MENGRCGMQTEAMSGLLKFAQIPPIRSVRRLLNKLVQWWVPAEGAFIIGGERLEITLTDVYFLTGLPRLGEVGDILPRLPPGVDMEDLLQTFCADDAVLVNSSISLRSLREWDMRAVGACVLQILGAAAPHRMSGGQTMMVDSVL
jgi:hypothetical protein